VRGAAFSRFEVCAFSVLRHVLHHLHLGKERLACFIDGILNIPLSFGRARTRLRLHDKFAGVLPALLQQLDLLFSAFGLLQVRLPTLKRLKRIFNVFSLQQLHIRICKVLRRWTLRTKHLMNMIADLLLRLSLIEPRRQVLDLIRVLVDRALDLHYGALHQFLLVHLLADVLEVLVYLVDEELVAGEADEGEEVVLAEAAVAVHVEEVERYLFQTNQMHIIFQRLQRRDPVIQHNLIQLLVKVHIVQLPLAPVEQHAELHGEARVEPFAEIPLELGLLHSQVFDLGIRLFLFLTREADGSEDAVDAWLEWWMVLSLQE